MRFTRTLTFGVLWILVLSVVAQAQSKPPQYLQVITLTVKPGAVADYEEYRKKFNAAQAKTAGAAPSVTYAVTYGGPGFTYMTAVPFEKFADREGLPSNADVLTKAYGQAEANRILKSFREAIVQQRTEVFTYQPNSSLNPKGFDPPSAFISLARAELNPGMGADYAMYLTKLKIAQEKAKDPRTIIRRTSAYGTAGVWHNATLYTKLSERDATLPPLGDIVRQAFGENEANQLLDINRRAVRTTQLWLLTYRADLSRPKPGITN